jgi:hypothetical protein
MRSYVSEAQKLGCPSAPEPPIKVFDEPDRPQPRLDRDLSKGYTVSVGRVREDESGIFDIKFVALSHNSEFPISTQQARPCFANTLSSRHRCCRLLHPKRRSRRSERLYLDSHRVCGCIRPRS